MPPGRPEHPRELLNAPTLAPPGRRVKAVEVEVAAAIFTKLKRHAEELHFHAPVDRAVVTCPAAFDILEREPIEQAARLAGFTEVRTLEEPVAAALADSRAGLGVGRHVLVYDLGGGTFDLGCGRLSPEAAHERHPGGNRPGSGEIGRPPAHPRSARPLADEQAALAGKVYAPCVVAVVGRVKAGKSTFINALLGAREDLATVGTTETTATINYFRYGRPAEPERPVRCYWRAGGYEDCPANLLRQLQGTDLEMLRRAEGIDHLEYRLELDYLCRVTLVDTPGTGAVVDEHQGRTAEYMRLYGQLRERHDRETQQIGESSDAII
ncbi:Hsp70 family protein [uncultured Thiodictyon sp.]|uniref:Hsp70 family protein n=1 Tax=uncultured Thiodictyon sp. TaxID=1846217 RepID=UPI0025FF55C2|nr:Hsp70 family protein [uncultured Thiodictyon sp.]